MYTWNVPRDPLFRFLNTSLYTDDWTIGSISRGARSAGEIMNIMNQWGVSQLSQACTVWPCQTSSKWETHPSDSDFMQARTALYSPAVITGRPGSNKEVTDDGGLVLSTNQLLTLPTTARIHKGAITSKIKHAIYNLKQVLKKLHNCCIPL